MKRLIQEAPWPEALEQLVEKTAYRLGFHQVECGLHGWIRDGCWVPA